MAGFLAAALAATIAVAPLTEVAVKLGLVAAGAATIIARGAGAVAHPEIIPGALDARNA